MIPYAILSGTIFWKNHAATEFRVLDLSADSFTFRLARTYPAISEILSFRLSFFAFEKTSGQELILNNYNMEKIPQNEGCSCLSLSDDTEDTNIVKGTTGSKIRSAAEKKAADYYQVYRLTTTDPAFQNYVTHLSQEYTRYIRLKLEEDDATLSHELTGYPLDADDQISTSYQEWKEKILQPLRERFILNPALSQSWKHYIDQNWPLNHDSTVAQYPNLTQQHTKPSLSVDLNCIPLQQLFLTHSVSDFYTLYMEKTGLAFHPLKDVIPDGIVIGNQYCRFLFPDYPELDRILAKACDNHLAVSIAFPPIRQQDCDWMHELLAYLNDSYPTQLELILNDYGMAYYIHKHYPGKFHLTSGVLLNKRKKDTRLPYKNGYDRQLHYLQQNPLNADFFRMELADELEITSHASEPCGYSYQLPQGKNTLFLPFYQMNTSGHCVRHAYSRYGCRDKQVSVSACPRYCEKEVFLYPDHLHMIGYQNSLFGFDEQILWNLDYFQQMTTNTNYKIVLSFPYIDYPGGDS